MKRNLRLLLTSAALITPSVFGDSSTILRDDSSARFASGLSFQQAETEVSETEVSFGSCVSLSSLDGVDESTDSSELYHSCIEFPEKKVQLRKLFKKL